jgi:hypothetical protein
MAIPNREALESKHVLKALEDLDRGVDHPFGKSTRYELVYRRRRYAPKAVVGLAMKHLTGELLGPDRFSGGEGASSANRALRDLGFTIVPKEDQPAQPSSGTSRSKSAGRSDGAAAKDLKGTLDRLENEGYFSTSSIEDEREKTFREIVSRRGQGKFRESLLKAYQGKCAVSGCDAESALEAAHLISYLGKQTNHVQNGILLRADIHTLFDLDLIGIDPRTLKLCLAPPLTDTSYSELEGCELALPLISGVAPSPEALKERWKRFKASVKK